jgi:hypothetical protein
MLDLLFSSLKQTQLVCCVRHGGYMSRRGTCSGFWTQGVDCPKKHSNDRANGPTPEAHQDYREQQGAILAPVRALGGQSVMAGVPTQRGAGDWRQLARGAGFGAN